MKIIPLSEGSFTIDRTKVFIPFDKSTDNLQERATGSLLVEIQPFAIVTRRDVLLLDTGLGFHNRNGIMQLHQNLLDNGIQPQAVTRVLLSHLHKDHAGGIQNNKHLGTASPLSFPNATYYVNRKEFEFASSDKSSSYVTEDFNMLESSGRLQLLDDHGWIDGYIRYELCGAHCPYHMAFWIEEEG